MSDKTGEETYLRKKIQLFDNTLEHLASAHQKWKYIENFLLTEMLVGREELYTPPPEYLSWKPDRDEKAERLIRARRDEFAYRLLKIQEEKAGPR